LEIDDVEPAAEFIADFFEVGGLGEAVLEVEGDAGFLVGVDEGEDGVMAGVTGAGDGVGKEKGAGAATVEFGADVDGVFDGVAIGGAGVEAGERGPADDLVVVVDGDGDGEGGAVSGEPLLALLGGGRLFLVGAGGVEDEVVVDVVDYWEVGGRGEPDGGGHKAE